MDIKTIIALLSTIEQLHGNIPVNISVASTHCGVPSIKSAKVCGIEWHHLGKEVTLVGG
jgi:hypothetical protein